MYDLLFSPGKIGGLTLPNRIAMTAASASLSQPDGTMTEDMLAYYEARAKGGVGLIITEMVCVDEDRGVLFPRELNAAREENIPSFRRLADRVHPHGTKIFAQLFHPGANADPKLNPLDLISASPARGKKRGQARAATAEEIHAIAAKFGQAARRVQEAGFDGVEVHAGHHYFLHSFLSPVTNHRTDGYGGSLENRTRILREIVEAIRAACGRDFPLMFRISLEEYIGKDGYHADTGIKICQMLEGWGVDAINVTASGTDSKLSQSVEPMYYPQGWRKHLAKAVKGTVSIPVLSVALIRDAKARGVQVTAETCPHYLLLTDKALESQDADYRMNPPLREEEDRLALIEGLKDGTLDAIATDHAPHTPQEKADFRKAPNGSIGMETSLAATLTALEGVLTLPQILEKMSTAPARILGIPAGTLQVGANADVVLFDPQREWVVDPEKLHGKSKNTPFKGMKLKGKVALTIFRGRIVYDGR